MLESLAFTALPGETTAPESAALLAIADAVRHLRPMSIRYTAGGGRRSDRTIHPYGLVVHWGRWYVTGADLEIDEDRTFRLDRIGQARTFVAPAGLDPAECVLSGFAKAPYRYEVTLRIQGTLEQIRARLPASVASVVEPPGGSDAEADPWLRVELRVERFDWLPSVLALLDRPFVIERLGELRELVTALADRLVTSARRSSPLATGTI